MVATSGDQRGTSSSEGCAYAAVCRLAPQRRACAPPVVQHASDLLIAVAGHDLLVCARRQDRLPSACTCQAAASDSSSGGGLLSRQGFACPHVARYDDVALALTLPLRDITQVYMTYQTTTTATVSSPVSKTTSSSSKAKGNAATGKGVAARTRDLVVRAATLVLWLEFEHNLARGGFLEGLTAACSASSSSLEIDYLDLSDAGAVAEAAACQGTIVVAPSHQPPLPSGLLRDAWRHVVYEKIKLALQVAHDGPSTKTSEREDDPAVAGLLTTAMELSTRLDEPDLNAFTWLASGFLNLRAPQPAKQALARTQVLHGLELARENSLDFLTCLALQCAASAFLTQPDDATSLSKARELLTEATRLLTHSARCAAMEPALKMQLHATLLTLNERRPSVQRAHSVLGGGAASGAGLSALLLARQKPQVARSDSSSSLTAKDRKPPTAFSLWAHVFGGGTANTNGSDAVKRLVLERVEKDDGGGSLYVDVLGAHGVHKARFRVFYGAVATLAWLSDHINARYKAANIVTGADVEPDEPCIELFYDPQRKQLAPSDATLREWMTVADKATMRDYTLHAKLAPRVASSHRSTVRPRSPEKLAAADSLAKAPDDGASLLCSLCGARIPLSEVEDHSEACFQALPTTAK